MNFLLLHGSWHGAWCWHKVLPRLIDAGHTATAIDLPGHGLNAARPIMVGLRAMVDCAERVLPRDRKTVVVVHSRNGIVASALAERVPDRVAQTIYLAAFMIPDGRRVLDYLPDRPSLLTGHVTVNRLAMWDRLHPAAYREALYADCSDADIELAHALLVREPVRPALTRLRLSEARYGTVPRAYIRLTQDRAVSLALQDRMIADSGASRVASLDASHSAYFSQPDALAATILSLAHPS